MLRRVIDALRDRLWGARLARSVRADASAAASVERAGVARRDAIEAIRFAYERADLPFRERVGH